MGKPAAVIGSMHVCPKVTAKVPHIGGPVVVGSPNVKIGGLPAARKGDKLVCVGPPDIVSEGASSVFINGKPAARMGDGTAHGGKIVIGNPTVLIGDSVGAGSGGSTPTPKTKSSVGNWGSSGKLSLGGGGASGSAGKISSGSTGTSGKISPKNHSGLTRASKSVVKVTAGQSSGDRGKPGTWAAEIESPQPNTIYEVTSTHAGQPVTYTYETDSAGRTVKVKGKLVKSAIKSQKERDKLHRNTTTQSKYGGPDPGYDGGHLVGTLFQGPAEKVNLVPQLKHQNRHGDWRQMEKKWAQALGEGKEVEVEIILSYSNSSTTPDRFAVKQQIDGKKKTFIFDN
ncbi:TPA: DNA/RNA non-specific endonuclease [Vibrio parahaemolyticus]|nr:DNA/RNA non-specific endonuclease [Vibrio alginolyticus]HCG7073019.1 DNA/RNA non-specific endonuclease [Vibrio parahaemolyticus]AVF66792.1 hypothetical protein AL541_21885 [Vibrio alginolyticus]ELB2782902.1 DNA/RNA non-specific endonuclease [Vibrio alginolyticus]ELN6885644.1 DNA/RNA non-specific endonuclease [Vibrio alginolyticus]EME9803958.1 DNA/RNA non-specific endonuclease [Vibrio alginolyticus]